MKWEYKTVQFKIQGLFSSNIDAEKLEDELNVLGNSGWELVDLELNSGSLATNVGAVAILKRPK